MLAERNGTLWSADARGGVMRIDPVGNQTLVAQMEDTRFAESDSPEKYILKATLPNGLVFDQDGNILIANVGTDHIELMTRDGQSKMLYTEIDGEPLSKTNFILRDSKNRVWFTVTTHSMPWTRSINEKLPDGYVGLIDDKGIRVVAEGFVCTNEIRLDAFAGTIAPLMTSVTFGGPDLKAVYLGSLRGTTIPYFQSPVAGLPMVHW
jgi:gluconolactonase